MKKTVIDIRTRVGIEKIDAYVEGDFAVHKTPKSNGCADSGKVWQITHVPSGLGCGVVVNTRKEALAKIPQVIEYVGKIDKARLDKAIAEFNEMRGIKTKSVKAKASKGDKKMAKKTSKKETQKDVIARLERENAELKARLESLEKPENTGIETFDVEGYMASRDNEHRITPELIKAISKTKGLKVERRGADEWLYVTGDTKPYKEIFKAMGFRFSGKETAWFLAPYPLKSPKRYNKSNDKRVVA